MSKAPRLAGGGGLSSTRRFDEQDAVALAYVAHAGQIDKSGKPYILHPLRVMASLPERDSLARMAAVFHDVLEDTAMSAEDLLDAGVPAAVVAIVERLTHLPGEPNEIYWERVEAHPVSRRVKLADIADNLRPERLDVLPSEVRDRLVAKYASARRALGYHENSDIAS